MVTGAAAHRQLWRHMGSPCRILLVWAWAVSFQQHCPAAVVNQLQHRNMPGRQLMAPRPLQCPLQHALQHPPILQMLSDGHCSCKASWALTRSQCASTSEEQGR